MHQPVRRRDERDHRAQLHREDLLDHRLVIELGQIHAEVEAKPPRRSQPEPVRTILYVGRIDSGRLAQLDAGDVQPSTVWNRVVDELDGLLLGAFRLLGPCGRIRRNPYCFPPVGPVTKPSGRNALRAAQRSSRVTGSLARR